MSQEEIEKVNKSEFSTYSKHLTIYGLEGKGWGELYEKMHIRWPGAISNQGFEPQLYIKNPELESILVQQKEHGTLVWDSASATESCVTEQVTQTPDTHL